MYMFVDTWKGSRDPVLKATVLDSCMYSTNYPHRKCPDNRILGVDYATCLHIDLELYPFTCLDGTLGFDVCCLGMEIGA